MSYNNKRNRIEERVYSVTMTEEELRLFSEFLEQREFEDNYRDIEVPKEIRDFGYAIGRNSSHANHFSMKGLYLTPSEAGEEIKSERDAHLNTMTTVHPHRIRKEWNRGVKKGISDSNLSLGDKLILSQDLDIDEEKHDPNGYKHHPYEYELPKELKDNKHRMSSKYVIDLEDRGRDYMKKVDQGFNSYDDSEYNFKDQDQFHNSNISSLAERVLDARDVINKEDSLSKSKYDDKYSSKRIEKFLDKKIDADKAKNIVDRRHSADKDYLAKDTEKGHNRDNFHISDIGRKWNDTGIVYNEALGRNLNKDAAIAAGVTAGLVGGGIALKKHLKKKKQEKELAENKYKTSDDKKKKK